MHFKIKLSYQNISQDFQCIWTFLSGLFSNLHDKYRKKTFLLSLNIYICIIRKSLLNEIYVKERTVKLSLKYTAECFKQHPHILKYFLPHPEPTCPGSVYEPCQAQGVQYTLMPYRSHCKANKSKPEHVQKIQITVPAIWRQELSLIYNRFHKITMFT